MSQFIGWSLHLPSFLSLLLSFFLSFFFSRVIIKQEKHSSSSIRLRNERERERKKIRFHSFDLFFYLLLHLFSPPSCVEVTHVGSTTANVFLFVTRCFPIDRKERKNEEV